MSIVYDVVISTDSQFKQGMMAALGLGAKKLDMKLILSLIPTSFLA